MKDQEKKEKKEKKEKRPKKKRSLFGRIIVFLLAVLALAGLLAMAMSVLCSYVDPTKFVWLTFFGLMFWAILFFNLVVFALLLLLWSRKVWISVIALLVALPGIYKSFSTGVSQNGGELRVMSYNVLHFKDQYDEEKKSDSVAYDILNMIREYQPDVLCLQEFSHFMPKKSRKDCIVQYSEMMGFPHYYFHEKKHFGGNVIFSKYPLYALEEDIPFAKENEYGAVARVDAGAKGVFYVVNCHLTSFQLTRDELTVFSERNNNKEQMEEYGKSIVSKLVNAYKKRSQEVNEMLAHIPHDGRPILLCGDFNDTPLSYTYQQIHGAGFIDGFVKAGHGIGRTYAGKLPLLRIDYIWANEQIQPMSFKRIKYKGSDHFPVMLEFNVNHGL